jgi:C-terminal processing protease CtpA/Prc
MHVVRRQFFVNSFVSWAILGACAALPAVAQNTAAPEISAKDAQRDLAVLKRALTELHPGLYRYATAAQMDAEFAAAEQAVAAGSDRGQMFLLASRIAAAVRCGHTWASPYNQANAVKKAVFDRADKLPITLRWVAERGGAGRALVTGSAADAARAGVKAGDELLAIDDRPVAEIASALLPYLRADGNHAGADAKRLAQLDSNANGGAMDRLFPLLFKPKNASYQLTLRSAPDKVTNAVARKVVVAAMALPERDRVLPNEKNDWQFQIDGDTATLTLPTFAFWRSDFKPNESLAKTFETLYSNRAVRFLIIDLRRNEGGDDGIGRTLLHHLLWKPFTQTGHRVESAYERAPYDLVRYLDTWNFGFFDRTGSATKGLGRNWQLPRAEGHRINPVDLPDLPFEGRTVMLVGPQNSSAGFLLARDMKASGAATLVGQTTGGNLRGLNGGQLAWINLPASGVGIDIPLLAAVYDGDVPDAGVQPDVVVPPSFVDTQAGIDTEMAAAKVLLAQWRTQPRTKN